MGRLFESPWAITIIIIVVLLLFAAPKLPGMARSLGQSMRIIKSEVKEMKNDGKDEKPAAAPEAPVEGKIVNNPAQPGHTTTDGTGSGTGAQS
ncbi:Sec-independent protein translocase subunit TatA [Specibacter sp. RAF43]|uniref:Sec-independent protein translocase subunit TatA n=1 Tax=Specibacter sp. RAF43 TaxID=3233057 RepID=UPI003F960696